MITKHNPELHATPILRPLILVLAAATLVISGCASQPTQPETAPSPHSEAVNEPSRTGQDEQETQKRASSQPEDAATRGVSGEHSNAPIIREDAPLEYTVKPGDTLWDIAGYYLKKPWLWPEIWRVNPQVENPHLIYPGDTLYLVKGVGGQYHVSLRPGAIRLEPHVIRKPLDEAIPTIPIGAIKPFLSGPRVVPKEKLQQAGYIVSLADDRILAQKGEIVYATELGSQLEPVYQIVHPGKAYKDPETGKILGYKAIPTARARLVQPPQNGKAAVLKLTDSNRETDIGDKLLPLPDIPLRTGFTPHAPEGATNGQIIASFSTARVLGEYQIVALDLGHTDGVEAGTVLAIYRRPRAVQDPHHKDSGKSVILPKRQVGLLMIFKADKHMSHAIIMESAREIQVGHMVQTPDSSGS